jgi:hypothetical protein
MYQDRLIVAMVAYILEEEPAAEQRDLERGDVDVRAKRAPCVCAYAVGDESREEAVEVEEEEDGQNAAYEEFNQEYPKSSAREHTPYSNNAHQLKPSRGFSGSATMLDMTASRCVKESVRLHGSRIVAEG